jgi:hypothetical protein
MPELMKRSSRAVVVAAASEYLDAARHHRGGPPSDWLEDIADRVARRTARSLRPVLNATGVVLHTNLGRAPLAEAAIESMARIAGGYATLEFDLHSGGENWLPTDPQGMAEVTQWLALSNNEIHYGLQWARGLKTGIRTLGSLEEYLGYSRSGLQVLEGRLKDNQWLAAGRTTIADLACYPYVSVSHEAGLPLDPYPGVSAWVKRVEALPGWVKRV